MTKRILESQSVYTGDLHIDVLPMTFSHLDLAHLLMAERVCKTWHKASISYDALWAYLAYRKSIFDNRSLPIRTQVIQSFKPFCEAARKILCKELRDLPTNLSPIEEKLMIDQVVSQMDKPSLDPLKALLNQLSIDNSEYDPIQKGIRQIDECIKMIPVWVETGTLTINEDLLNYLFNKPGRVNGFNRREHSLIADIKLYTICLFKNDLFDNRCSQKLPVCEKIHTTIFSLVEYILHFSEKPSLNLIKDLYDRTATIQLCFAWYRIGATYYTHRNILNPLLENMKGSDWEEAFAKFMQENNAPVSIEIQYPPFLKGILQKLNKTEVQELIKLLSTPISHSNNPYILYMYKQIQKNREQFLLTLLEKEIV